MISEIRIISEKDHDVKVSCTIFNSFLAHVPYNYHLIRDSVFFREKGFCDIANGVLQETAGGRGGAAGVR